MMQHVRSLGWLKRAGAVDMRRAALCDGIGLGAGFAAGEQQSVASRARLDVLRVAFAMYSEQATMYRPFLGMVQRVSPRASGWPLPLHVCF